MSGQATPEEFTCGACGEEVARLWVNPHNLERRCDRCSNAHAEGEAKGRREGIEEAAALADYELLSGGESWMGKRIRALLGEEARDE